MIHPAARKPVYNPVYNPVHDPVYDPVYNNEVGEDELC
jgi:hypothetical protein